MTLTRLVNGERVEIPADEEARIRAKWAAEDARPPPVAPLPLPDNVSVADLLARLRSLGLKV